MFFFNAVVIGFMVFVVCVVMKRYRIPDTPTPPFIIGWVLVVLTLNHVVLQGFIANRWGGALVQLLCIYVGFGCYLYVVGDIAHYRAKFTERRRAASTVQAPEDDPNWSKHRP